ncbi:metallophosphoesterase family protein [Sagittula sp. S175]|uniref:metallophosphoesterase family protein n=1 Tax=Sagittula sp. S175 TaxID=3415129 RepID=UPI003C7E7166
MTKLIHTADVHLDSPLKSLALRDPDLREHVMTATRTAFARIVDAALDEEVAAVLIAGDLFDGAERSARTGAFLTAQLDRLRAAGIKVYYIKGNHDAENPITGELTLPDNVHVFTGHGGKDQLAHNIFVHGVSFSGKHAPESLLPKFPAPVPGAVNIAMLHTSLAGAAGHDVYAPCTLADLSAMGFDYWALGHVHKRQLHSEAPWIVMPGCPQGRDMGEAGPKSATLIEISDHDNRITSVSEISTSIARLSADNFNLSDLATTDAVRDALRAHVRRLAAASDAEITILRLTFTGATPLRWQMVRDRDVWEETAREMARDTGTLWIEKVAFDLSDPLAAPSSSATDDLARLMDDLRAEPGFQGQLRVEMEALLSELPASRRAALLPDAATAESLTDEIARAGAHSILARMKGVS